jgi:hypothetical protein
MTARIIKRFTPVPFYQYKSDEEVGISIIEAYKYL